MHESDWQTAQCAEWHTYFLKLTCFLYVRTNAQRVCTTTISYDKRQQERVSICLVYSATTQSHKRQKRMLDGCRLDWNDLEGRRCSRSDCHQKQRTSDPWTLNLSCDCRSSREDAKNARRSILGKVRPLCPVPQLTHGSHRFSLRAARQLAVNHRLFSTPLHSALFRYPNPFISRNSISNMGFTDFLSDAGLSRTWNRHCHRYCPFTALIHN